MTIEAKVTEQCFPSVSTLRMLRNSNEVLIKGYRACVVCSGKHDNQGTHARGKKKRKKFVLVAGCSKSVFAAAIENIVLYSVLCPEVIKGRPYTFCLQTDQFNNESRKRMENQVMKYFFLNEKIPKGKVRV